MNPVVAAFDFDGTLTRHDTLLPFLKEVLGSARLLAVLTRLSPVLAGYATGVIRNDIAKERLLTAALGGMDVATLSALGEAFAADQVPRLLRPVMMNRLRWHHEAGHICIVVSASLGLYLRPWARAYDVQQVICTELETNLQGQVTGHLLGGNCFGHEKARRLAAVLPAGAVLYAYGDSRGDREMLAMAQYPWFKGQPVDRVQSDPKSK